MGIRDKFGFPGQQTDISPESYDQIKSLIVEVYNRSTRELRESVANLRIEVNNLKKRLEEKSQLFEMVEPYLRTQLTSELRKKLTILENSRKEAFYKKFFCGDLGLLYVLGDILSGLSEMRRTRVTDSKELIKYYGKVFYPITNNLIILTESLKQHENNVDLENTSISDLISLRGDLNSKISELNQSLFYTQLWNASKDIIHDLCSQDYENKINSDHLIDSFEDICNKVENLKTVLGKSGLGIIEAPNTEFMDFFKNTVTEEIPSKPLVIRLSDKYVYTYGLWNTSKPYIL